MSGANWQPTCCEGSEADCRLHQIAAMSRNDLMDALVDAEENMAMAEAYIAELIDELED